nr:beta-N-acetylhexosaminidase [Salimicrobium jeotgali]
MEEKIGQLFCIGFDGEEMNEAVLTMIREKHVGNVILFSRNITSADQVRKLTDSLKEEGSRKSPLFVAIDQENGIVNRIPRDEANFPGARALGYIGDTQFTKEISVATASLLREFGIDMNLAPVLDVNSNRSNPVIGLRAFGEDKHTVMEHGVAFMEGHESQGVVACAKHFPGHGDTSTDSHLGIPVVDKSYSDLLKTDIPPFRKVIVEGCSALIISHVIYPALGEEKLPATLSPKVINEFLRETLGFDGVVVTDCLEMKAVSDNDTPKAAVQAFLAGADIMVISHTFEKQKQAIELLLQKVQQGEITEARINESFRRVMEMKSNYSVLKRSEVEKDKEKLEEEAYSRSLFINVPQGFIPAKRNNHVHVLRYLKSQGSKAEDQNDQHLYFAASKVTVTESISSERVAEDADVTILVTDAGYDDETAQKLISTLSKKEKPLLVIAIRTPYILDNLPDTIGAVATFNPSPNHVERVFREVVQKIFDY